MQITQVACREQLATSCSIFRWGIHVLAFRYALQHEQGRQAFEFRSYIANYSTKPALKQTNQHIYGRSLK